MTTMSFASQKIDAITFPVEETTFFGEGEPGCFLCIGCLLVSGSSGGPKTHPERKLAWSD